MEEHEFAFDGHRRPNKAIQAILEEVGTRHGARYISYRAVTWSDPKWAFVIPNNGRFEDSEIEDRIHADLLKHPAFVAWIRQGVDR